MVNTMDEIVLKFLKDLEKNNNRDWFNEHKKQYEAARFEMEKFVDHLILNIRSFDPGIGDLTSKQTMFRIYRDVRFSKDKTPYKTYFGAYMAAGGRKSEMAGYYVHISPEDCFVGGGSYHPSGENLKKIRSEIYYNLDEFKGILSNAKFMRVFGELKGDKLTRPPQGFQKDVEGIEYLKFKDFTVFRQFDAEEIAEAKLDDRLMNFFRTMKPFNDFLNRAINE